MSTEQRLYSESEVSQIVERAVHLQENSVDRAYTPGVTSEELKKIAAELGVEAQFLDAALRERLSATPQTQGRVAERVVEGEFDPADFDLLLENLKVFNTRHHPVQQLGRTLNVQAFAGGGVCQLEVTSRSGRTRLKATSSPVLQAMGTFYPATLASLGVITGFAKTGHPFLGLALAAGFFTAATVGFNLWNREAKRGMRAMLEKVADWVVGHNAKNADAPSELPLATQEEANIQAKQ